MSTLKNTTYKAIVEAHNSHARAAGYQSYNHRAATLRRQRKENVMAVVRAARG